MWKESGDVLWVGTVLVLAGLAGCDTAPAAPAPTAESPTVAAAGAGAPATDLSGTWVLNREESERPVRPRTRPPRRAGEGPRGERPPERPGIEPPENGPREAGEGRGPRSPVGPDGRPAELRIEQTESSITFSHEGGRSVTLPTDGSVTRREGPRGTVEVRASWEDGVLAVVHGLPRGGTLTRSFALETEDRLRVTVRREHPEREASAEHTLVFDRAEE